MLRILVITAIFAAIAGLWWLIFRFDIIPIIAHDPAGFSTAPQMPSHVGASQP